MDEQNIIHRMLAKGDALKERYRGFDFGALDSTQHKYLKKLTFFSRWKDTIARRFNGTRISHDVKVMFLD